MTHIRWEVRNVTLFICIHSPALQAEMSFDIGTYSCISCGKRCDWSVEQGHEFLCLSECSHCRVLPSNESWPLTFKPLGPSSDQSWKVCVWDREQRSNNWPQKAVLGFHTCSSKVVRRQFQYISHGRRYTGSLPETVDLNLNLSGPYTPSKLYAPRAHQKVDNQW